MNKDRVAIFFRQFVVGICLLASVGISMATADIAPIKSREERAAIAKAAEKARSEALRLAEEKRIAAKKAIEEKKARAKEAALAIQRAKKAMVASQVTLRGKMRLSDALAELHDQTENRLVDYRGRLDQTRSDPELDLDLENVSYWAAVEEVLDQADLILYAYTNIPNTMGLAVRPQGLESSPPISTTGLFRVQVTRLSATSDFRDADQKSLTASLEVAWEPRIAPLVIYQSTEDLEAIGDDGQPLELISDYGVASERVQEGIGAIEMNLPFHLPQRSVQKIETLRGRLTAEIPAERKRFTFDDLETAKDVVKRDASLAVVLQSAKPNRDLFEFRIVLKLDDVPEQLRLQQGWIYSNAAYLIHPSGKRIDFAGLENYRSTPDEIGLSYKFPVEGSLEGYQFVYESPSNVATVPVGYELKGIALP